MIKIILTTLAVLTLTSVAFAQTAEEMQQKQMEITYKIACLSDAEVAVDAELIQIVGSNPDAVALRETFQSFVADPKAAFETSLNDFNALVEQEKAALEQALATNPQVAEALKKGAEEYAAANKVSIEEATAKLKEAFVSYGVQQKTGIPDSDTLVFTIAMNSCGLANYIQPKLAQLGCKTKAGDAIDMTVTNQFCQSISADMASLEAKSVELSKIEAITKATIDKVVAALQAAAQAEMAPISQSMEEPIQKIVDAALNLIGTPAPVVVPNQPK